MSPFLPSEFTGLSVNFCTIYISYFSVKISPVVVFTSATTCSNIFIEFIVVAISSTVEFEVNELPVLLFIELVD